MDLDAYRHLSGWKDSASDTSSTQISISLSNKIKEEVDRIEIIVKQRELMRWVNV